ncbi:hypothetical protein GCM10023317_76480 [Actinopolymorpha pittospori]
MSGPEVWDPDVPASEGGAPTPMEQASNVAAIVVPQTLVRIPPSPCAEEGMPSEHRTRTGEPRRPASVACVAARAGSRIARVGGVAKPHSREFWR